MPMYNLLEYSKNYRKTIGSLCNYYRDELSDNANNNNFLNNNVVISSAFQYKNKFIARTYKLIQRLLVLLMMILDLLILTIIQIDLVEKK